MPGYRQRWQARYGTSGDRWEDAEPGYRYGYDMRNQPQYRGRAWSDVEPEFQRDWTQRNPGDAVGPSEGIRPRDLGERDRSLVVQSGTGARAGPEWTPSAARAPMTSRSER